MGKCHCNPMAVLSTIAFLIGILLFCAGVAMVIAFGIHYVQPYDYSTSFVPTMCNVTYANVADEVTCSCSPSCACDCTSSYPCLTMTVQYRLSNGTLKRGARLYDDYITLKRQPEDIQVGSECSVYVCNYDENDNRDDVIAFRDTYGRVGKRFICHYNPDNLNEVLRIKMEQNMVILTMLIAFGSLFVGIIMAVFTWRKCS